DDRRRDEAARSRDERVEAEENPQVDERAALDRVDPELLVVGETDVARGPDAVPALERVLHRLDERLDQQRAEERDRGEQQQIPPQDVAPPGGAGPVPPPSRLRARATCAGE